MSFPYLLSLEECLLWVAVEERNFIGPSNINQIKYRQKLEVRCICFTYPKKTKTKKGEEEEDFINEKENRRQRERGKEIQFANFILGCSLGMQIMWLLGEQPCHLIQIGSIWKYLL